MKKSELYVGQHVRYTGSLKCHPDDGGGQFEGIVKAIKKSKAHIESSKRAMRQGGRKWYDAGTYWGLNISMLSPVLDAKASEAEEPPSPPAESHEDALQRILGLLDEATSEAEEFVYLRELHRLLKLEQPSINDTPDDADEGTFPANLVTEGQALQWARNQKVRKKGGTLPADSSTRLTRLEIRDALAMLNSNITARIESFSEEDLQHIFKQLKSACRGEKGTVFECQPKYALRRIAKSGREHTESGHTRHKKDLYQTAWGRQYTLGHKNVLGGEPSFRRTTESELYTVAFMILELGRPLTKADVANVQLSPSKAHDKRIKRTCL